jgi:hypothetical protein
MLIYIHTCAVGGKYGFVNENERKTPSFRYLWVFWHVVVCITHSEGVPFSRHPCNEFRVSSNAPPEKRGLVLRTGFDQRMIFANC